MRLATQTCVNLAMATRADEPPLAAPQVVLTP